MRANAVHWFFFMCEAPQTADFSASVDAQIVWKHWLKKKHSRTTTRLKSAGVNKIKCGWCEQWPPACNDSLSLLPLLDGYCLWCVFACVWRCMLWACIYPCVSWTLIWTVRLFKPGLPWWLQIREWQHSRAPTEAEWQTVCVFLTAWRCRENSLFILFQCFQWNLHYIDLVNKPLKVKKLKYP